jgi:hypothetical protein
MKDVDGREVLKVEHLDLEAGRAPTFNLDFYDCQSGEPQTEVDRYLDQFYNTD